MTDQEHRERHELLHRELDELVADFISYTKALPSEITVMDLVKWSFEQTKNSMTEEKHFTSQDTPLTTTISPRGKRKRPLLDGGVSYPLYPPEWGEVYE